jgi:hypothetical protein
MNRRFLIVAPIAVALGLQAWRPNLERSVEDPAQSFFTQVDMPVDVRELLETSCADCHSQRTDWPWYAHIAPVGQWLVHHVEEGSQHFSLSRFGEYPPRRQQKIFHEIAHEVDSGAMPLRSYLWLHGDAKLSDAERQSLVDWAKAQAAARDGHGSDDD